MKHTHPFQFCWPLTSADPMHCVMHSGWKSSAGLQSQLRSCLRLQSNLLPFQLPQQHSRRLHTPALTLSLQGPTTLLYFVVIVRVAVTKRACVRSLLPVWSGLRFPLEPTWTPAALIAPAPPPWSVQKSSSCRSCSESCSDASIFIPKAPFH